MSEVAAFEKAVVVQIASSPVSGGTMYRVKLDTGTWLGMGKVAPKYQQGSVITVAAKKHGRGFWEADLNTLEIHAGDEPGPTAVPAKQAAPKPQYNGGGLSRDDYWKNKEAKDVAKDDRYQNVDIPRMSFSSAQERAVALVTAALAHDCLKLPGKKADKLDALYDIIDEATDRFFLQSMHSHERLAELYEERAKLAEAVDNTPVAGVVTNEPKAEEDWDE